MADESNNQTKTPPRSMSMIEPRFRDIYLKFYKESYFTPTALDLKTKELIAIGASLVAKCEGCLDGHITKALEIGCTKEEISDAIVVAIGIAAAGVLDMSDKTAIKLDLHHFEGLQVKAKTTP
ncbi:MAG TPA: carboxymuconolactone decarboxylase family protein [Terriglobia bacterium]|nr:carboxymuconolactone decarboxylase family protein [Terriglobia bacterium]